MCLALANHCEQRWAGSHFRVGVCNNLCLTLQLSPLLQWWWLSNVLIEQECWDFTEDNSPGISPRPPLANFALSHWKFGVVYYLTLCCSVLNGLVRVSVIFPELLCNHGNAVLLIFSRFIEEGNVYLCTYWEKGASGETQIKGARGSAGGYVWGEAVVREGGLGECDLKPGTEHSSVSAPRGQPRDRTLWGCRRRTCHKHHRPRILGLIS